MLIRALLFSLLVHVLVLLASAAGNVPLRLGALRSPGLRVTLVNRQESPERVVVSASSGWTAHPPGQRLTSGKPPASRSAWRSPVMNEPSLDESRRDLHAIVDETEVGADVFRQYRLDLARAARQFRQHPTLARRPAREGEVLLLVSFALAPDNPAVELVASSASPELDAEAVALVAMAVRSVSVPVSLRGRQLSLSLTLRYSPRDD